MLDKVHRAIESVEGFVDGGFDTTKDAVDKAFDKAKELVRQRWYHTLATQTRGPTALGIWAGGAHGRATRDGGRCWLARDDVAGVSRRSLR